MGPLRLLTSALARYCETSLQYAPLVPDVKLIGVDVEPVQAGQGEPHIFLIEGKPADGKPLEPGKYYLGIDAASWFVNKESRWFADRMASGTLEIKMSSGLEQYKAALGTYELAQGAKTAPVFDRPVLPDRSYRGGPITIGAFLTGVKKDTTLTKLLKSASGASLGIVAGMVESASAAGPLKVLSAAGEDLIGGVKSILSETADKREPFFDFSSGLEKTFQPGEILSDESYVLFHRGSNLNGALTVAKDGRVSTPRYRGLPLRDGAWLLLRIRRSTTYAGVRPWFESARKLRGDLTQLVDRVADGELSKDEAMKQLKPSASGDSLYDRYLQLRAVITDDAVLIEAEALSLVNELRLNVRAARDEISKGTSARSLAEATKASRAAMIDGGKSERKILDDFQSDAAALISHRLDALPKRQSRKVAVAFNSLTERDNLASAYRASVANGLFDRVFGKG